MTFFYLNKGCTGEPTTRDGIVSGTSNGDTIISGFEDADGDRIDGNDAILPGETGNDDIVDAGAGDDFIQSLLGDDEVHAGSGSDTVEGGAGNDVIYGDGDLGTTGGGGTGARESFEWDKLPDPNGYGDIDDNDPLAGILTQDTGDVTVTFETIASNKSPETTFSEDHQKVHSIVDDGNGVDKYSSMASHLNHEGESATYRWTFSQGVEDVSFRINDIDFTSKIIIKAYDADGNLVSIDVTAGNDIITEDNDTAGGTETLISKIKNAGNSDVDPEHSALIYIDESIVSLEVTHVQYGAYTSEVNITDIYYAPTVTDAGDGDDLLDGGEGDDVLYGEGGDDTIYGGTGTDTIDGGDGSDEVYGGDDADLIKTGGKSPAFDNFTFPGVPIDAFPEDDRDYADGGAGNDTITTGDDRDTVLGGEGDDLINAGIDDDIVYGGDGNDTINDDQGSDYIDAGAGDDSIVAGIDIFSDYENDDPNLPIGSILSDPATEDNRDTVMGGDGNDTIYTGDDADYIDGGADDDLIHAGIDDDEVYGGAGNDTITGGHGSDLIGGGDGDDLINAGDSALLWGQEPDATDPQPFNGQDTVDGGAGNDTIYGEDDDDLLFGGTGNDLLDGGIDEDTLAGGDGMDTLLGGDGNDLLLGEADEDLFQNVTFTGPEAGEGDHIDGGSTFTTGIDYDTLDLRGSAPTGGRLEVEYTSADREDGIVHYFDNSGAEVGRVTFEEIENIIPCFTPGTVIATPKGERLVEELRAGDRIITRDNGIQEIRWVGAKALNGRHMATNQHLKPVLIQKGSLGHGLPERDMLVSPNHRMLVNNDKTALYFEEREVLVAAKHLTGVPGIDVVNAMHTTYIHFMFDRHEVVLSNGAWTESFQPGEQTLDGIGNAQRNEIFELFPELKTSDGIRGYHAARRTLKKHEANLLAK
ncbi:MAG: Hint domain-containing protein [Pseudooceanicola sp.]